MDTHTPSVQSRRQFLAGGALLGGGLVPAVAHAQDNPRGGAAIMNSKRPDAKYELPLAAGHRPSRTA